VGLRPLVCFANPGNYTTVSRYKYTLPERKRQTVQSAQKLGLSATQLKVHTPHADVRARNGFFVTNATINPETSKKIEIENALPSPFDSTGMALTVRWRYKIAFGVSARGQHDD